MAYFCGIMHMMNYLNIFFKLALIIILAELSIMFVLPSTSLGVQGNLFLTAFVDAGLLILLSAFPVYWFVYKPIVEYFTNKQRDVEMLGEALQGAGDSVVITSPSGDIIYVNTAFTNVTGYSKEEAIGSNSKMLSSSRQGKNFYKKMWRDINEVGEWRGEIWNKRKNGELYPEDLDIRAIKNNKGNIKFFVGVFSDLTEKKAIENALLQSQKLEAIGTLVGGVAHNFNNLLAAISGKAYLAERSLSKEIPDKETSKSLLSDIQNLSQESASLVKQLLTFARETEHDKRCFDIVDATRGAIQTAGLGIYENVEIEVLIPDGEVKVFGDEVHIKQTIINIINNARDAVIESKKKEPRVSVSLGVTKRMNYSHENQCVPACNRTVEINITDNGDGINKIDLNRIFEPFFTTKKDGKGTGLGLSTSIGTIKDHGGEISVKSKLGEFTSFLISLPIDTEEDVVNLDEDKSIVHAKEGGTVLVVDDNENVREVIKGVVLDLGYKVIIANDGVEALEIFKSNQIHIKIVITDIVMPKMDGAELVLNIRKHDRSLPVILMTGYDIDNVVRDDGIVTNNSTVILMKPVEVSILSKKIHDMILYNKKFS